MMCNGSLQCSLRGGGDYCGISWIGDLGDAQNPQKMLLVDIQCFIVHITSKLFECKCLDVIAPYLSSNSQIAVEKVILNSLKEMVPSLLLNFSILPKELLISMVYMGVEVMACNRIYSDGVKIGVVTCVPH
jgi:hypothetical protein